MILCVLLYGSANVGNVVASSARIDRTRTESLSSTIEFTWGGAAAAEIANAPPLSRTARRSAGSPDEPCFFSLSPVRRQCRTYNWRWMFCVKKKSCFFFSLHIRRLSSFPEFFFNFGARKLTDCIERASRQNLSRTRGGERSDLLGTDLYKSSILAFPFCRVGKGKKINK